MSVCEKKARPAKESKPIVLDATSADQRRQEDAALAAHGQRIADAMTKPESVWDDYQHQHAQEIWQWERRAVEDEKARMPEAPAYEPEPVALETREEMAARLGLAPRPAPPGPVRWW